MDKFNDSGFLFPYIRFFNASPQGGSIDFYIGNTLVAAGIGFGHFTSFIKAGSGMQFYKATRAGRKDEVIADIALRQNIGEVHSLCVVGKADKPEFTAIEEPCEKRDTNYSNFRVCNLSPEETSFDVFANDSMILGDIKYKEVSDYMQMVPDNYEIAFSQNKKRVPAGMHTMKQDRFGTLYIIGLTDEQPFLRGEITIDAGSYGGFYL